MVTIMAEILLREHQIVPCEGHVHIVGEDLNMTTITMMMKSMKTMPILEDEGQIDDRYITMTMILLAVVCDLRKGKRVIFFITLLKRSTLEWDYNQNFISSL